MKESGFNNRQWSDANKFLLGSRSIRNKNYTLLLVVRYISVNALENILSSSSREKKKKQNMLLFQDPTFQWTPKIR